MEGFGSAHRWSETELFVSQGRNVVREEGMRRMYVLDGYGGGGNLLGCLSSSSVAWRIENKAM